MLTPKEQAYNKMNNIQSTYMSDKCFQSECSFTVLAEQWLQSLKPQLKESSYMKYRNILDSYLIPEYGAIDVTKFNRNEVADFINKLLTEGGTKKSGLSPKTVMSIVSVLKNVLDYASNIKGYETANLNGLTVKQSQPQMRILSRYEQEKLSKHLCQNLSLRNLGILVCLYTGLRIGEICALKWEDIIFDEQYLYVHKTMQRIQVKEEDQPKTSILISSPKSPCSVRRIPIPNEVFQLLSDAKCSPDTYLLTGQKEMFIEPRTMQNHFKSTIKACNINDANFHSLRHTFATRCIELGFDVKSLSEILGHASVNITMNRYVHPSMELKQKNMNMLSGLLRAE